MKVLALTIGDFHVASTQYRLGQFVDPLRAEGISLTMAEAKGFADWPSLPGYDLVIVQKRLMRASWVRRVRKGARRLIFDTDDAIWEPHGKKHSLWTRVRTKHRLSAVTSAADACTVPNGHLAAYLGPLARRVCIIPMALDPEIWREGGGREDGRIRIGWSGSPPNLAYLLRLAEVLHEVQKARPQALVTVYCGKRPEWPVPLEMEYHDFSPGTEPETVRTFDIGLLPLPDDAFAAGKSPIKALQYAACGIPCVANPVGATAELVREGETGFAARDAGEWRDRLIRLIDDVALRRKLGENALRMFRENHTRAAAQKRVVSCWREIVRG